MIDWAGQIRNMRAEDRDALREALEDYDYDAAVSDGPWPSNRFGTIHVDALTVPNMFAEIVPPFKG